MWAVRRRDRRATDPGNSAGSGMITDLRITIEQAPGAAGVDGVVENRNCPADTVGDRRAEDFLRT
jgi:hypothetical protein